MFRKVTALVGCTDTKACSTHAPGMRPGILRDTAPQGASVYRGSPSRVVYAALNQLVLGHSKPLVQPNHSSQDHRVSD